MIEFLCPNGHRIRCQAAQAGRAAKCPRCGVKFIVPEPTAPNVSPAIGADADASGPEFMESGASSKRLPTLSGSSQKERAFEFLCPNGHRLHGPVSLQGQPGECPLCKSRFRIPTYENVSTEEEAAQDVLLGRIDDRTSSSDLARLATEHAETGQAMASLFVRLWDLRSDDATIEIRLRDGEAVVPYQFLKKLSQQSRQGVFTVQEPDGSTAVVVVAWHAVARVTVRGLGELPKELAD
ncbi:MAG: hypothetical protein LLF97_10365 [Planctomycetaceae bacterium]|nr:hypothetical protein [Planctomycetaceae bacterium]